MQKIPLLPKGMSTAAFGHEVMKWGTGDDAALDRISSLTREELIEAGITAEIAAAWQNFYVNEVRRVPQNPSARGRAQLMEYAVRLLNESEAN